MYMIRGGYVGIKPIPLNLLPSEITYKEYIGKDRFNKPTYKSDVTIKRVRIEEERLKVLQGLSESDRYTHILYHDCINTLPNNISYTIDSLILKDGKQFVVKRIKTLYTFDGKLHHYEIELIA